jgi:hypothetical protein
MHPTTINDYDYDYDYRKHSIAVTLDLWGSPVPAVQVKEKTRNQAILGLTAMDSVPFPKTPMPTQTFPSANAVAVDFLFFGTSLPQRGGRGGVGARSSSSKNLQQQQHQRTRETR